MVQIYKEDVIDLLNPESPPKNIREDPNTGEVFVEDLVIVRKFGQILVIFGHFRGAFLKGFLYVSAALNRRI